MAVTARRAEKREEVGREGLFCLLMFRLLLALPMFTLFRGKVKAD